VLGSTVFLSFTRIPDPARHRDYNAWHQLDHRPENLALAGVLHGERWVRCPACAAAGPPPADLLAGLHYVNAYWFADPAEASIREWQELAERSVDLGRRPDLRWAQRQLMGFFDQLGTAVSPRLPLSAAALPFRPALGAYVSVEDVAEPRSASASDRHRWHRQVRLPRLLAVSGVAGASDLASRGTTLDPQPEATTTVLLSPAAERGRVRVLLAFLDEDPVSMAPALAQAEAEVERVAPAHPVRTLFRGVLRGIVPWGWDWFDGDASGPG
jgi:hypothetical protein